MNLIGKLAYPPCMIDSHRVAGKVDLVAYRLDQGDI